MHLRLGLSARPHVGDNVIHGSASPLEARSEKHEVKYTVSVFIWRPVWKKLSVNFLILPIHWCSECGQAFTEKMNWLGRRFDKDPFAKLLKDKGEKLRSWEVEKLRSRDRIVRTKDDFGFPRHLWRGRWYVAAESDGRSLGRKLTEITEDSAGSLSSFDASAR